MTAGNDTKSLSRADLIAELQSGILRLEGFKPSSTAALDIGLGALENAFPGGSFPVGCVHEFLSAQKEDLAATTGFISGLLGSLMGGHGASLWISCSRTLFPPALKCFGIQPDRFIFIDVQKEKDVLWVMNEALKCGALTTVVAEVREISFTASRRLQLAVEESLVTGFVLRNNYRSLNTTACVSRWKITAVPSDAIGEMPGIGFPKWKVELLRMRNGKPGVWDIQWMNGRFMPVENTVSVYREQTRKAG